MQSVVLALPALPGGADHLREFSKQLNGSRRAEFQELFSRLGVVRHGTYIQQTPQGELILIYLEGPDLAASFAMIPHLELAFDHWFFDNAKQVHGVDFREPLTAALPEVAYVLQDD